MVQLVNNITAIIAICVFLTIAKTSAVPCVTVKDGELCGVEELINGTSVCMYFGVPYAKRLTEETRFLPPEQSQPFNETFNATSMKINCSQTYFVGTFFGKTDCLILNIYVPSNHLNESNLAVMVFIHGGAFMMGGGSIYNGSPLAQEGNVIVVTLNYRLGPFGFGYLPDSGWQGNVGLLDQRMALQWVRENIAAFGGNPELITIFGESAGAASVSAHLAAPDSRSLYNHAIAESGSIMCQWGLKSNSYTEEITKEVSENTGCVGTSTEIFTCVNSKSSDEILKAYSEYIGRNETRMQWLSPIEDDKDFFGGNAFNQMKTADFKGKSVIIGTNGAESGTFVPMFIPTFFDVYTAMTGPEYYDYYGQQILMHMVSLEQPQHREDVLHYYSPPRSGTFFEAALQLSSDFAIRCCAGQETLKLMLPTADYAYSYLYNHTTNYSDDSMRKGPKHGNELPFVFGDLLTNPQATESEIQLSRTMMRYWANFAKFGKPTDNQTDWQPVEKHLNGSISTKVLDTDKLISENNLKKEECSYWKSMNEFIPTNKRNHYI